MVVTNGIIHLWPLKLISDHSGQQFCMTVRDWIFVLLAFCVKKQTNKKQKEYFNKWCKANYAKILVRTLHLMKATQPYN